MLMSYFNKLIFERDLASLLIEVSKDTCKQTLLLLFVLNVELTLLFPLNFLILLTLYKIFNEKNFQLDFHIFFLSKGHVLMYQKSIIMRMTSLGHNVGLML